MKQEGERHSAGFSRGLFQDIDAGTEVDVIGGTIENESWHGSHPGGFGFGDSAFLLAEVNDLHVKPLRVERGGNVLFGGDADRATRMIEYGFGFHDVCFSGFVDLMRPDAGRASSSAVWANLVRGHFLVG
jgi:hypothetical protein